MATIQTGGHRVGVIPQIAPVNPRAFATDPTAILRAFDVAPSALERLDSLDVAQGERDIARATQPARRDQAIQRAEFDAEMEPRRQTIERLDTGAEQVATMAKRAQMNLEADIAGLPKMVETRQTPDGGEEEVTFVQIPLANGTVEERILSRRQVATAGQIQAGAEKSRLEGVKIEAEAARDLAAARNTGGTKDQVRVTTDPFGQPTVTRTRIDPDTGEMIIESRKVDPETQGSGATQMTPEVQSPAAPAGTPSVQFKPPLGSQGNPIPIKSKAEAVLLAPGTWFLAPDGMTYQRKQESVLTPQ